MNGIENNELTWKERVVGYEQYWWNEIRKMAEPQEKTRKIQTFSITDTTLLVSRVLRTSLIPIRRNR